ncbi:Hypothetical protein R9X50_00529600 [Acrodontium crateriforme]|uniref:CFEM domain-containing protein n=1 Tax=Acrodontium crateriforme TaxID=150365 RepID=A0AAQ3MCF3_9PEZI|nr:Hypothetical protein R9X50_00529600 [Acrodontium crateriforme]
MAMLPSEVQSAVPTCAQSCVSTYISEQYDSCTNTDFSCMCTQYSSQGYTLGEFAYICLQLDCPQASQSTEASLYNICTAQANAVSPTHSTLTIPATSITASVTSNTPSPTGSQYPITSSTATTSSKAIPSTTAAASSTRTLASATAGATSSHLSTLTSAQAVGVSIGAFSALIITVCIAYCIACMRGRRYRKIIVEEKNYDFVDQLPSHFSPYERSTSRFQVQRQGEKKSLPIYNSSKHSRIGYAQNSDAARTLSQLLPELPGPNHLQPPPKHPGRVKSPPQTPATMFEEDRSPMKPNFPLPDHPLPTPLERTYQKPKPREKGLVYTSAYTLSPENLQQPSLSIKIPRQAPRTKIPSPVPFPPPPIPQKRPVVISEQRFSGKSQGSATSVLNYYTSHEAGSRSPELDKTTPIEDATQKRRPVPKAILVTKPAYPPRAVRYSGGSDTSFESNDPDEPTPPEEEEAKNLSPVAEHSPIAALRYPKVPRSSNQAVPRSPPSKASPSRLQGLCEVVTQDRNKMPNYSRSLKVANSTVEARGPKTPEQRAPEHSSLSGSTLAAKRSKSNTAEDLEHKLKIDTSHSRAHGMSNTKADLSKMSSAATQRAAAYESPLKGYGRVASPGTRSTMQRKATHKPIPINIPSLVKQEVFVRSPLWEPKLTPSRRGDDLYLSVGMASP